MSAWTKGTYTRKGLSLLSKLTQGSSLKITKAVTGSGYVSPEILANQTAVSGVKQNLSFKAVSYPEVGTCKLPMFVTNKGLASGYKAKQIGLYAMDPDEGEILFFISQSESGTDVPSESAMPEYSATWSFYFRYGQADDVDVTVDPSHTVSEDMLGEVRIIAETGVSTPNLGEVLSLKNTANLPFANLRILGKTTQNGTPSPSNPVSLVSAGASGSVNVRVYGKNLFNVDSVTGTKDATGATQGAGFYDVTGGVITNNQGSYGMSNYFLSDLSYLPRGIYKISCDVKSDHDRRFRLGFFTNNGRYSQEILLTSIPNNWAHISATVEIPANSVIDGVQLQSPGTPETFSSNNAQFRNVQIAAGTDESEFESFKPAQNLTLSYPNGVLRGVPVSIGGNYTDENGQEWVCDEIDLARGVYVKRVHSETVALSYDEPYNRYVGQLSNFAALRCAEGSGIPLLSNILPFNPNTAFASNGIRISSSGNKMLIACYNDVELTSATVAYPLETPIETPLTIAELAAFNALKSNNPHTTIINDGGANMEADCFLAQHEAGIGRLFGNCVNESGTLQLRVTRTYHANGTHEYFIGGQKIDGAGGVYLDGEHYDMGAPTSPEWASSVISLMQCKFAKISFDCSASWAPHARSPRLYDAMSEGISTCNLSASTSTKWEIAGEATRHLPRLAIHDGFGSYANETTHARFLQLPTQFTDILRDYDSPVKWDSLSEGTTHECGILTITGYN